MQEAKHTNGPWNKNLTSICGKAIGFHITDSRHGSLRPICDFYDKHGTMSPEEIDANARLIAAAPELLEALGYCESWFATHHPTAKLINGHSAEHPMLTCIRAAIAKATMTGPSIADLVESGALPPPPRMDGQQHG